MSDIRYVSSSVLGNVPASVYMDSGIIEVNVDLWDKFTDFQKDFIIEHEIGHFKLQTDSESEADAYALKRVYGKCSGSLKKAIETLYVIGVVDKTRLRDLYVEALKIDAFKNGNEKAIKELKKIGVGNMKLKETTGNSPFVVKSKYNVTGSDKNAAEGHKIAQAFRDKFMASSQAQSTGKKTGFSIGDHFVSYELILLSIMIVLMLRK